MPIIGHERGHPEVWWEAFNPDRPDGTYLFDLSMASCWFHDQRDADTFWEAFEIVGRDLVTPTVWVKPIAQT